MARDPEKPRQIRWYLLAVVLGSAFALPVYSQSSAAPATPSEPKAQIEKDAPQSNPSSQDPRADASPPASPEEARETQIEEDTRKLYQLSAELRAEVAKTYKESLSIAVLKKAEEIEKLARNLKLLMNQEVAASRK